jgi:hypothetical protein
LLVAIDMLLGYQRLTLHDPDVVSAALAHFRKKPTLPGIERL